MRFSLYTAAAALLATLVAAQTSTSSAAATSTSCAAAKVFQACLVTENLAVTSCDAVDYSCLCSVAQASLEYAACIYSKDETSHADIHPYRCYTLCPNASGADTAQTVKDTFCSDASFYASATTTFSSSVSATGSTSATTTASMLATNQTVANNMVTLATATTPTAASTTKASVTTSATGGAQHLVIGAGGFMAALASFMVIFL